nr:hypothetical protein B0A51_02783 [Rachicladosporium sp. CCFEE 5018]
MGSTDQTKNHALIYGATGIQGWAIVNELLKGYPSPDSFSKVTALVNRPPSENMLWPKSDKLQVISGIDLQIKDGQEALEKQMREKVPGIETVTHVFFFAYIFKEDPTEEIGINVQLLERATLAVEHLSPALKFVLLPTGTKAYGVQALAEFPFADKLPLSEDLPRIPEPYRSQNFYYNQSLAGFKVRKPGQYKRTSYWTAKETLPMINTHEYIHASVRYRIDEGANGVESDWSSAFPSGLSLQPYIQWLYRRLFRSTRPYTYLPQTPKGPLEGWKLEDGHLRHEGTPAGVPAGKQVPAKWVWTGPGEVSERVLEEDVLGPFEIALKDLDPVAKNKMQVASNGVAGRITQGFHPKTI